MGCVAIGGDRVMSQARIKSLTSVLRLLTVISLLGIMNAGCSVFMAMSGKEDANISALHIGQDRAVVIANLGEPEKTVMSEGKTVDFFRLQKGNAPSAGRALAHGALDLATFGVW